MPMTLEGSCQCGAITFSVQSQAPVPYQRCYCSICRKTAGTGGYAVNLSGMAATLHVHDPAHQKRIVHAVMGRRGRHVEHSSAERHFCGRCGTALWLYDAEWPDLVHPAAGAIDTELPEPPARVHIMLGSKADWVQPDIRPGDGAFDGYPEQSLEEWHRAHGLWHA
ncbi:MULTISPECIES: GFA family protein [Nguyenibacter]|uniref:GFA family protein n=1 Tax=Nguyenibacter vanlangensis TaxID=1216886 RepID=A0A7Y7IX37_9PROT|nr:MULTISPECIES: GFA family protein [Nguyenibacter]NVN11822.1 GFA family protein [Nguyenibacter vanlangensis]WRH88930.1 GFA family protein [Nguyenibacter sp. L1]